MSQINDAGIVAEKLIAALGVPTSIEGHLISVKVSIGISLYPNDGNEIDVLLERADAAMYRAKRQGGSRFAFHGHEPKTVQSQPPASNPAGSD